MLVDFRDIVFININFDQKNILYTTPKKINLISHFPKLWWSGEILRLNDLKNPIFGQLKPINRCKNKKLGKSNDIIFHLNSTSAKD